MAQRIRTTLAGAGHYLPERVVTNDELAASMSTTDAWIRRNTGIRERRYASPGEGASHLAARAAQAALEQAGLQPADLDLIIFATLSPDVFFPGAGVFLGAHLGVPGVPALDVRNQCSGFLYGLHCADAMIRAGLHRRVLLVGAEVHSTGLDFSDAGRDIAVLFGDGAGAVVLVADDGPGDAGVLRTILGADGRFAESLWCRAPASAQHPQRITAEDLAQRAHFPSMQGKVVFKHAVTRMRDLSLEILQAEGLTPHDVDLFIPHQANLRIAELVQGALGVPPERFYNNIDRCGNTTAATIPIALSECIALGRLKPGDLLCSMAFGSGFTWGATLLRI